MKIQGFILAELYQDNYFNILFDRILNHPAIRRYELGDIIATEVVKSDDGRIYNITLPANTGGTHQSRLSLLHYRAANGKNYNFGPYSASESAEDLSEDGFDVINAIETKNGTKYLMQGQVISCLTCLSEYI